MRVPRNFPDEYSGKVESVRVTKHFPDEYLKRVESVSVPKNGRIRSSTRKRWNPCEYIETFRTCSLKGYNQCQYRKMVESRRVLGKGRIGASTEKLSRRVPEKLESVSVPKNGRIRSSTRERWNRCEYRNTFPTST